MSAWLRCLILVAALLPAAIGARESPSHERHESKSEERAVLERYQANYKGLKALIAEATKLQTDYLEGGDLAAFQKAGATWEARTTQFLRKNLAPLYANEFAHAKYFGPDLPAGQAPKARAAYQRIEARKVALKAYTTELRKPD